jgi:signal peptidase I
MSKKKSGSVRDTITTVIYAGLIALTVRTFAYEPFNIPSSSMLPTLLVGDYLFVSKLSYGYSRHSFPLSLSLFSGRVLFTEPERGDVMVFKLPKDNETDYIKRIVGLPGDRIQVRGGILHINGKALKRRLIGRYRSENGNGGYFMKYQETLPNGRVHPILERTDHGEFDNTLVYRVPPDHYFAMGDNRDNSLDSRALTDVGFIPKENLVGRADLLFFSSNGSARFWEFWNWPAAIRFARLFQKIE